MHKKTLSSWRRSSGGILRWLENSNTWIRNWCLFSLQKKHLCRYLPATLTTKWVVVEKTKPDPLQRHTGKGKEHKSQPGKFCSILSNFQNENGPGLVLVPREVKQPLWLSPCDLSPYDHGLSTTFQQFPPPYVGKHWADLSISHHSMKGVAFSPPTNKSLFLCVPVVPCWLAAPLGVLVEDLRLCWELHFWPRMWEDVGWWCVMREREVWNLIWWCKFTYCTEKTICRSEEYNRL